MTKRDDNRIYVGNLPPDIRTIDVEDLFFNCGRISYIDLKNRKGPPFVFVAFEDHEDAVNAVKYRDAYEYDGYTLRVEFPKSAPPGEVSNRGRPRGAGVARPDIDGSGAVNRGGPPSRRSEFRVAVSGLPSSGSWQDLKDHMREAGDVCYADVYKDGTGVVEFLRKEDMKWAVKNLTSSKFRSHENELSHITVKQNNGGRESRSPIPRGRDSPSYSPIRHSRSRSRSL